MQQRTPVPDLQYIRTWFEKGRPNNNKTNSDIRDEFLIRKHNFCPLCPKIQFTTAGVKIAAVARQGLLNNNNNNNNNDNNNDDTTIYKAP